MPPYTPNKSKAQQRKMFVLASEGKLSQADAIGKARASHYGQLPEHAKARAKSTSAAMTGLQSAHRSR